MKKLYGNYALVMLGEYILLLIYEFTRVFISSAMGVLFLPFCVVSLLLAPVLTLYLGRRFSSERNKRIWVVYLCGAIFWAVLNSLLGVVLFSFDMIPHTSAFLDGVQDLIWVWGNYLTAVVLLFASPIAGGIAARREEIEKEESGKPSS